MGMPFAVIFSVILIAFFLAAALFAIKHFMDIKKCTEVGMFLEDLETEINHAWASQSYDNKDEPFTRALPSGIKKVCFANLSQESREASKDEKLILDELKKNPYYEDNLFFYPQKGAGDCISYYYIKHVNVSELSNPYCIENKDGKVKVIIKKGFYDALVKVSRT